MQSIFAEGPIYGYRLAVAAFLSILLMFADVRYQQVDYLRQGLAFVITPLHWVVSVPGELVDWGTDAFASHETLLSENESLRAQLLVLQRKTQQLAVLQAENQRLRELVNASERIPERVLAAQLIGLDPDPYTHQVIINKGLEDGVYLGQPLLDAKGLMGQIIQVDTYTSRALLVADSNHAVPVQVNRNGLRSIAVGNGSLTELQLIYVPDTADIQEGDLLVTSGLGGRFPEGYPVAVVSSIEHDPGEPFARITATPSAELNRSKNVLLVLREEAVRINTLTRETR